MKEKSKGQIYTPEEIVKHMLYDVLEWSRLEVSKDKTVFYPSKEKHIIDNSCGDGAFLCEIVDGYCCFFQAALKTRRHLKTNLETYIHGIELDPEEHRKCIENLDRVAEKYGLKDVKWDVQNRDALSCHDYDGKMDYVIGNPPYVRVHNLECDLTGYSFADGGMTDLYLAFYELGFRMLNKTGKLCYITPSSWFLSVAGQNMRDYVIENQNLAYVEDYGHKQLFKNATTYVAITCFNKNKNYLVKYVQKERTEDGDGYWTSVNTLAFERICIDGKFYFGTVNQLKEMREIIEYGKAQKKGEKPFQVKNGFATLADDIFIVDMPWRENQHYIPTLKSSTGKWARSIYPYDENGKLIEEDALKMAGSGFIFNWLLGNKKKLEARSTTEPWYAFGRTQAINDVRMEKWAIKSIVKTLSDVKPVRVPAGSGVYGGLYILTKYPEGLKVLETQDFMNYVKMLGKYKSGGYYTFSSKELENYLNWKYGKKEN